MIKLTQKKLIPLFIVIILVAIVAYSFTEEQSTLSILGPDGDPISTTLYTLPDQDWNHPAGIACSYERDNPFQYRGYAISSEMLNNEYYTKSWSSGGSSETISINTQGARPGMSACPGMFGWLCHEVVPFFSPYWHEVQVHNSATDEWILLTDKTGIINPLDIATNMGGFGIDNGEWGTYGTWDAEGNSEFVCNCHNIKEVDESVVFGDPWENNAPCLQGFSDTWYHIDWESIYVVGGVADYWANCIIEADAVSFQIKGPHEDWDAVRVSLKSLLWWYNFDGPANCVSHCDEVEWAVDYAYLREGEGNIQFESSSNPDCPPNIYEVGDTVDFKVTTGWSSSSSSAENWQVQLYAPDGSIATQANRGVIIKDHMGSTVTTDGTFTLPDNQNNLEFYFEITSDAVQTGDPHHQWTAKLLNEIITYDESFTHIVELGLCQCGPDLAESDVKITEVGGVVSLNFLAYGEQDTGCVAMGVDQTVEKFSVTAQATGHQTVSHDFYATRIASTNQYIYVGTWPESYATQTTVNFYAHAISGGVVPLGKLPSGIVHRQLIVGGEDDFGTLNIQVTLDGQLVEGASVAGKGNNLFRTDITNAVGHATLYLETGNSYVVSAAKDGYIASTNILFNENGQYLSLELTTGTSWIWIIVTIIIMIIFIIVGILLAMYVPVPMPKAVFALIIISIGVAVSIIFYLFMSGILYIIP